MTETQKEPLTRKERLATFRVPGSIKEAYNFGLCSAMQGYGRFSIEEFFQNDVEVRDVSPWVPDRNSLYRAYKRGVEDGRARREAKLP